MSLECWFLSGFKDPFWRCQAFSNRLLPGVDCLRYLPSRTLLSLKRKNDTSFISWPLMLFRCYWFSCVVACPWLACFQTVGRLENSIKWKQNHGSYCPELSETAFAFTSRWLSVDREASDGGDRRCEAQVLTKEHFLLFLHLVLRLSVWNIVILACDTFIKYGTTCCHNLDIICPLLDTCWG